MPPPKLDRRTIMRGAAGLGVTAALGGMFPGWAMAGTAGAAQGAVLSGERIRLDIGHTHVTFGGREGHAVTANGTMPGPLIRLKEGQNVRLSVANGLREDTSIHWHGLIVPFQFDGVPGISFPGIRPGQVFDYEFPIRQAGTYWYHSHSNMQEAMGLIGPLVIDPAGEEPAPYEREHVIVLSDWSSVHPHMQLRRLKQQGGYYNRQKQTLKSLLAGRDQPLSERMDWGKMRMDPTDISDVTGSTYDFLINGHDTAGNWTGLFAPGERVRLRIINASSMTNFNFRLPGLPMTVVAADGQDVEPVETDEFQIGIAETYDVIVRPEKAEAIAIIAEAIDRSGLCRATLAPQIGMVAATVPLRQRPLLAMKDMGMDMSGMDMASGTLDLSAPADAPAAGGHGAMKMRDKSLAPPSVRMGPGVATISAAPADRLGDLPTGLEDTGHRVLTYADLRALVPAADRRAPGRELEVHLTANMERYMWSFDGVKLSENPDPLAFRLGERVRVTLVNDTMMPHPIHLHGHFFELVNGAEEKQPRKHTVNVLPGGKASFDLTADAPGDWAFHCHMLLHMHSGMFRVVTVRAGEDAA
ncbi:copper resistance system multicopper oxidase [Novosphingobium sp. P6W]|uniref:copper resistance system multicopper oxidase n=1 Tax=Novosphingobium sp. P6W TaxID=1609758 RepID=UPI0005C2BB95|nr:copper resistance system multicopper oxidase [Novosphingobium sp. P6W]AXB78446.1 copper resistance system multicopper oxidase [Novosphingobium sp. P6W]KIS32381.1 copper-binding protein [Novosphingobium sp. P6W]